MEGIKLKYTEIEKLIIIQSVIDKKTGKEASTKLNLSQRQIWRLVDKIKHKGNIGIKHGNSINSKLKFITTDFKENIVALKSSYDYCDTNFAHFRELLLERENINISHTSLYKILSEYNIKSKKKHKDRKLIDKEKENLMKEI